MINPEYEVFDKVSKAVKAKYPKCLCTSQDIAGDNQLPAFQMKMDDNYVNGSFTDTSTVEKAVNVSFYAYVYSRKSKHECMKILELADTQMQQLGFVRKYMYEVPNYDTSIKRVKIGWSGIVDDKYQVSV